MRYSLLCFTFISLASVAMQPAWTPWNSPAIWDRTEYEEGQFFVNAFTFLQEIPARYAQMRENVQNDPAPFNGNLFVRANTHDIEQLKIIWGKCGQFPTTEVLKSILYQKYGHIIPKEQHCDEGAWLIAQHANHDDAFQQKVLVELGKLSTPTALRQYGCLFDRISLNRDEPQHFGTLLDKNGLLAPINGYDPQSSEALLQLEVINARRAAAGFGPLEESDEYKLHSHNTMILSLRSSIGSVFALPS